MPLLWLLALKWYSLDTSQATAGQLLRLASAQVADALALQVRRDFVRTHGALLEGLDHDYVRALDVASIDRFVRAVGDSLPFVDGLFVGDARSDQIFYFPLTGSRLHGPDERDAIESDPLFAALLRRQVNYSASILRSFDFGEFEHRGVRYHAFVHPLYATRERVGFEMFMGFAVSYRLILKHYMPKVVESVLEELRDELEGLDFSPVVSVIDEDGTEIYRSGRSLLSDYEAESDVPVSFVDTQFLDLRDQPPSPVSHFLFRTGYQSGSVEKLVVAKYNRERWLWAISAILVLAGLTLTARATYRDIRFARTTLESFSRLSHDAKTPLANIKLFTDTLKARPGLPPAIAQDYYDILSSQTQRLAHYIGGTLHFARIEAGVNAYHMEPLCLQDVLRSTMDAYRVEMAQKNMNHELLLPPADVLVMGSVDGLEQLFGNLIDNAIKYSPPGGFLHVGVALENGSVRVAVTDSGIGIEKREQRKIFKRFYQVRRSSGLANGCGLGLAIAAHITKAHKGRISVSSMPGKGTTFTVQLATLAADRTRV